MVVIVVFRLRDKGGRAYMTAMTCSARNGHIGVRNFRDVFGVDGLDHFHHHARRSFLRLGVVGKVEPGPPVRCKVLRVCSVACAAFGAELGFPLMHQLVHLLAGHGFGQDLKVGWRRSRRMRAVLCRSCWCSGWRLSESGRGQGQSRAQNKGSI